MNFDDITNLINRTLSPLATKMSQQRHLKAIRDAFMSILPITLFGSIPTILTSIPIPENTTNSFLIWWMNLVEEHGIVFNWINSITLGAMSLYILIGITYYLVKHYKENLLQSLFASAAGFLMLTLTPLSMGWEGKEVEISYLDGRGILLAIFVSIITVESYHWMKSKNIGRITMPDSVPASLTETFASLVPSLILLVFYTAIFIGFYSFDTTAGQFIYDIFAIGIKAADSLGFTIISVLLVHLFWFFGIHDAAFSGVLGPIRDGNLSVNATEKIAGGSLSHVFTTPFWTYFVVIGGAGSVLGLSVMMMMSKNKQISAVGKTGFLPALFNISEPIIFGTPIMINPIFFIPFLVTSTLNGIVTYSLMSSGVISKTFAIFSWQMPAPIGAYLATLDWKAPVLVIILILLNALIYYPFLKAYERTLNALEQ